MLPAPIRPHGAGTPPDADVRPGSWWRLVDENHALARLPKPTQGLVIMVSEARVIDGELHTIVIHAHPLWEHARRYGETRLLLAEFLEAFAPEPDGERLREEEISDVLGRVAAITQEMRDPPAPELLLERQTEARNATTPAPALPGSSATPEKGMDSAPPCAPEAEGMATMPQSEAQPSMLLPAALLPSQDVVAAQSRIEGRLKGLEAQKDWITGKTDELKGQMNLVALYQMEKVNGTLASISQETAQAESLLQRVQTMRLFLGEDMAISTILEGKSADPAEPLTFMQQMLYLDEELYVDGVIEGFSSDDMHIDDLRDFFGKHFSLVERMLPTPRCVAIVRIRREARKFGNGLVTMTEAFQNLMKMEADLRIHILVRDGERLSIITADEATSKAKRLFPSKAEIAALFSTRRGYFDEGRTISPDDIEYSDARARHDNAALFYKRFLVLLWGVFERTDIFGPFMPKGSNWLLDTVHSSHFRFIHDEENALTDGRPEIRDWIEAANRTAVAGSRIVAYWPEAANSESTPAIWDLSGDHVRMKWGISFAEKASIRLLEEKGANLYASVPCLRAAKRDWNAPPKPFNARARLVGHRRADQPEDLYRATRTDGWLCLDHVTIEDLDYYIQSRRARASYAEHMKLLTTARALLLSEREEEEKLHRQIGMGKRSEFNASLRQWRLGHGWKWPVKTADRNALARLDARRAYPAPIRDFIAGQPGILKGGLTAKGEIFIQRHSGAALPDGTALPWLTEEIYAEPQGDKLRRTAAATLTENPEAGRLVLFEDREAIEALLDRMAPKAESTGKSNPYLSRGSEEPRRLWRVPTGLFDATNKEILEAIRQENQAAIELDAILQKASGNRLIEWLLATYEAHKTEDRRVVLPRVVFPMGLLLGFSQRKLPLSWMVTVSFKADAMAWHTGTTSDRDAVRRLLDKVYQEPEAVQNRLEEGDSSLRVRMVALGRGKPLSAAWSPSPCLSFDAGEIATKKGPGGIRPTWRAAAAEPIAPVRQKDVFFVTQSIEDLVSSGDGMTFMAAPGVEELLARVWEMIPD